MEPGPGTLRRISHFLDQPSHTVVVNIEHTSSSFQQIFPLFSIKFWQILMGMIECNFCLQKITVNGVVKEKVLQIFFACSVKWG